MVVIRADVAKAAATGDTDPGEWKKRLFDDTAPTPIVALDAKAPHARPPELVAVEPADAVAGPPPAPIATLRAAGPATAIRPVATTAVGQPLGPVDDGHLTALPEDVRAVLQAAHAAARDLRARAEAEALDAAAQVRRRAEAEADRLLRAAEERAMAIRVEAERVQREIEDRAMAIRVEAERVQREAEDQAAAVRADSDRARKAMEAEMAAFKASLGDEEQQRQVLIRELEDLRTQRNEALDSYVVLRRTLRAVDVAIEKWHQDEPVANWRHARR